ncbi:hypothetical protein [Microbacterium sp. MMO-10]|uniref:hypothetical protein n=1 Tax=Microbacterium sp. MMO-10 TaxID=3081272 RepID=UPI003015BED0
MNALTERIDKVTAPAPENRAARRRRQQAERRSARQQLRSRARIERALSAFEKEAAA